MKKAAYLAPPPWRNRYEALRGEALGEESGGLFAPPLGVYLLRHYGLAEWMRRWPEPAQACGAHAASPRSSGPINPAELPPVPAWRGQLTVLLAQMAFEQLRSA